MKENQVVKACLDILHVNKVFSWRNNTGMTTRDYTRKDGSKGRSFIKYGEKGSPDIIGIFKGKFLGIECKVPGGRQTIYQKDFQAKIEQAGGIYLLINNPDTLIQWLSDA